MSRPIRDPAVAAYLDALPEPRRSDVRRLRDAMADAMPDGYVEGIQYGAIGYFVPHARYPQGYHCDPKQPLPFAGLAAQKHHIGLYLFCIYVDEAAKQAFADAWSRAGRKLDMGKGCVRVKRADDVPLDVLAHVLSAIPVDAFLERYEASLPASVKAKRAKRPPSASASTS